MQRFVTRCKRLVWMTVVGLAIVSNAGCGLRDTAINGFFSGVGDTISTVVSDTLLGLFGR